MNPETILADLHESGIELGVTPDNTGIVVPAGKLSPAQRAAVLAHKVDLIAHLLESMSINLQLLDAALQRCEEFKDSEKARQEMREQIRETPPHLRQDLLEHFQSTQTGVPTIPLKKQRENNHDQ